MPNKRKKGSPLLVILERWANNLLIWEIVTLEEGCPQFKPHPKYMDFGIIWKRNIFTTFVCVPSYWRMDIVDRASCTTSTLALHNHMFQRHREAMLVAVSASGHDGANTDRHSPAIPSSLHVLHLIACAASHCMCWISLYVLHLAWIHSFADLRHHQSDNCKDS